MSNISISAGVLAGGKSTRMGQNKALLQLNNRRFIDIIVDELSSFDKVLISAAKKGEYEDIGVTVVYDEHREIGPIEGIYQLLKHADTEYVFICGGDMPFVNAELVKYMCEFISTDYDCYCIMDEERIHPLCGIYSKKMLPVIETLIESDQYRLMNILNSVRTKYIKLAYTNFNKKVVKNINTKEEYKRLVLPVVFTVSAVKDSGKTGLIVKLINEFIGDGYTVSVIKHDGHDYVMDHEGTDTYRFAKAGATKTAIFSESQYSVNCMGSTTIEEMIDLCGGVDVIIVEGMKNSGYPKVEVVREAISTNIVCDPDSLICVATDVDPLCVKCEKFDLNDTRGIFLCIKKYFGLE